MTTNFKNRFVLHGEVVEVIDSNMDYKVKIMCKPGVMFIESEDEGLFDLGDLLKITGTFNIDTIEFDNKKTTNTNN